MTFPERLKSAMEQSKMTNYGLAKRLGFSKTTITNYLNGTTEPKRQKIQALANALNVDTGWLATGEEPVINEIAKGYNPEHNHERVKSISEILGSVAISISGLEDEIRRLKRDNLQLGNEKQKIEKKYNDLLQKIHALELAGKSKNTESAEENSIQ